MHCDHCGAEVKAEAIYCPRCGKKIDKTDAKDPDVTGIVTKLKTGTADEKSDAFGALYEATYTQTFGHIMWKIKNQDAADDLVQDVYATVWEKIGQLNEPKAFYGWFWTIVKNKCNTWLTDNGKFRFESPISDDEGNEMDALDNVADDELPLPENAIADEQLKALLLETINALPDNQRHAIWGFYYEEKKIQDLAEEMGSNENSVKTWLKRGRLSMAKNASSYANANGLKLAPVAILPLIALLAKKDVYACEAMAVHGAQTYSALQSRLGLANTAVRVSGGNSVQNAVRKAQNSAKSFAESDEAAAVKQAAKDSAEAAKSAAKDAAKAFNEKVAPELGQAVGKAASSGMLVKIVAGIVAAAVAIGGISALVNKGNKSKETVATDEEVWLDEDTYEYGTDDIPDDYEFISDETEPDEIAEAEANGKLHYCRSLEELPDGMLEEIANEHSACIPYIYWASSLQVEPEWEYVGCYLINRYYDTASADPKIESKLCLIYKVTTTSMLSDSTITLYEVDEHTQFRYLSDGTWEVGDHEYESELSFGWCAYAVEQEDDGGIPEDYTGHVRGFESPLEMEEQIIKDAVIQDSGLHPLISIEASFEINDLETFEWHSDGTHANLKTGLAENRDDMGYGIYVFPRYEDGKLANPYHESTTIYVEDEN